MADGRAFWTLEGILPLGMVESPWYEDGSPPCDIYGYPGPMSTDWLLVGLSPPYRWFIPGFARALWMAFSEAFVFLLMLGRTISNFFTISSAFFTLRESGLKLGSMNISDFCEIYFLVMISRSVKLL